MEPRGSNKGSVLWVDDAECVRRSACHVLKEYDFACAADAHEARKVLERRRFDLILLDLNLGKDAPTGLDCLRWLPEFDHRGAVCMLTGYLSPELLHDALLLGADDYLLKSERHLKAEVARLVELGRLPKEQRPQYSTIAAPGFLRSLRLRANQIDLLAKMVEQGFPRDGDLAESLGVGAKALAERLARIEARFGACTRSQLVRYLDVLSGFVRRSQLEWGSGVVDRSPLFAGATECDLPRGWGQ
jgi:DNA-binding NarL/FixJ family response regulator